MAVLRLTAVTYYYCQWCRMIPEKNVCGCPKGPQLVSSTIWSWARMAPGAQLAKTKVTARS